MPQYAPVVPLEVAKHLQQAGVFGHYHLLLAHDVMANKKEYEEVYKDKGYTIIMDNSVIELGTSVEPEFILEAASVVGADIPVLPDALLDGGKTTRLVKKHLEKFIDWKTSQPEFHTGSSIMAIPQGRNWSEWTTCANNIMDIFEDADEFPYWGVPRNLKSKLGISRVDAVKHLLNLKGSNIHLSWEFIHLFGFSDDWTDDVAAVHADPEYRYISGIDSAAPIFHGLRDGEYWGSGMTRSRDDWWDKPFRGHADWGKAFWNLELIRHAVEHETFGDEDDSS